MKIVRQWAKNASALLACLIYLLTASIHLITAFAAQQSACTVQWQQLRRTSRCVVHVRIYDMLMQHLMSALLVATSILSSQTSVPLLYFSTLCFYKVVSGLFEVFPPYAVCILRYAAGPALECKPSAT